MSLEKIKSDGQNVMECLKDLFRKGNERTVVIKKKTGAIVLRLPLTWVIIGALLAPFLAGIAVVLVFMKDYKFEIVSKDAE